MPGINPPADEYLPQQMGQQRWLLRALAQQQNYTCSDSQGRPVLNMGLIPGSNPAQYGLQVLNPATGLVVGEFVFNTGTGLVAQQYFNASGLLGSEFDANGFHVYDSSGDERVRLGLLADGDYGLAIYSLANDGSYTEVQPVKSQTIAVNGYVGGAGTTVPFGGPSVATTIGATGKVLVTISADMVAYKTVGTLYLYMDGAQVHDSTGNPVTVGLGDPSETQQMQGTVSVQEVISASSGSHTFTLEGNSGTAVSNSLYLYAVTLTVQPI